ncbi:MAG: PAS domain S-box protein [Candidatus Lokiarchaeota archaeon]|nr:PAS domain S-box protein [Candidatus Lokiarchaeota archaeon]
MHENGMMHVEAPLDKDEIFLSDIFASIDEGFIIVDHGNIKYVNERASQILGFPKQEIAEKGLLDFAASDSDKSTVRLYLDSVLHSRTDIREISFWVTRKDGVRCYVHCHFQYPRGDPALYRYIIITDITDLFRAESIIRVQKDLAVKVAATSDVNEIYKACLEVILEIGPFESGVIFESDGTGKLSQLRAAFRINMADDVVNWYEGKQFPQASMASFFAGTPIYKESMRAMDTSYPFGCAAMLPIVHKGTVVGIIGLISRHSTRIPPETRKSLETIAAQIGSAIARARSEAALHASEEKFRIISENVGDIVILLDERMRLLFGNEKSVMEKLGYTVSELSRIPFQALVIPEDHPRAREMVRHIEERRPGYTKGELRFSHKDGRALWFWVEATSYTDVYGTTRALITARDIHEKKEQELKLAESEKKYRLISENSSDLIFVIDDKFSTYYANEGPLLKVLGYKVTDLKSVKIEDLVHPEDYLLARSVMTESVDQPGRLFHGEVRLKTATQAYIWFDFECLGFIDEKGARRLLLVGRNIQGRKEQDLKLKGSEERYRLLLENTSDLVFLYDKNFNILYANEQVIFKKLEIGVDAFSKNRINEVVHPEDVIALLSAINFVKTRPMTTQQRELRIAHKNGHHRWFNAEFSSSTDLAGQLRIIGIFRDIHDRKLQSLRLKESEERYRLISENSNDIILLLDTSLKIVYCNERSLLKKTGYLLSEFEETDASRIIHPADYLGVVGEVRRLMDQPGTRTKQELRIATKEGRYIWFDVDATSYIDEQARTRLLLVARDIQEKKENDSKLIESLDRLNLITENVQDNISIINEQGKIEYLNKIQQHAAVYPGRIIGQDMSAMVHPEDAGKIKRFMAECFQNGQSMIMHRAVELPSGETRWFETVGNTFKDKDGNLKLLTISRDISERKKMEGLLESENLLLKEIDRMRKDFVLNATHELKTPLSIIIGATDFLTKYYGDIPDPKRVEFLNSIRKGSTRLKQLIETLLDYSRLESGRLQLQQLEDADISEIVHNAVSSLGYLVNRRQQEIVLSVQENVHARVDKFRIEQVIVNLISNAVKNTQPGGRISVELSVKNEVVNFSVLDTGIGLTPEEMSRIFKKFGKIERRGLDADIDIQGTGLGLFISKEIVEMHRGKIWAESAGRNKGSKFSFSIPVK